MIVLTGPPGAGKSTVAALVADRRSPSVHLQADDFWDFIRQGGIAPYLADAHRQNGVVIEALAGAAWAYAAGGYDVVVDGIVGPWFIDAFRPVGGLGADRLHYVVLRPDEETTLRRAISRGGRALTDAEPLRSLHRQFAALHDLERHALDSTQLSPRATADRVIAGIAARAYALRSRAPA